MTDIQPGCFSCLQPRRRTLACDPAPKSKPTVIYTAKPDQPVHIPEQQLLPYLHQYGSHILAHSTLQPDLHHFVVPGVGYFAYGFRYCGPPALRLREPVVLGDPVCAPEHKQLMAQAFLERFPKAVFMQVTREMAEALAGLGLHINSFGGETEIDLSSYSFSGTAKRGLRSAISSALKSGVTVDLLSPLTPEVTAEMAAVDTAWVKARPSAASRFWFINRKPVYHDEQGVVVLAARGADGSMQAWVAFDPMWQGGDIIGYYANVTRMRPDAHPGALNLIIKSFIDRAAAAAGSAPRPKHPKRLTRKQRAAAAAAAAAAACTAVQGEAAGPQAAAHSTPSAAAAAELLQGAAGPPGPDLLVNVYSSTMSNISAISGASGSPQATIGFSSELLLEEGLSNNKNNLAPCADSQLGLGGPGQVAAAGAAGGGIAGGARVLSLGLSPLFSLRDTDFKFNQSVANWQRRIHNNWEPLYPFKALALSKAKYGGGMVDGHYKDPNTKYRMTYLCHPHDGPGAAIVMYDVMQFIGLTEYPAHTGAVLLWSKVKSVAKQLRQPHAKASAEEDQEQEQEGACSAVANLGKQPGGSKAVAKEQKQRKQPHQGAAPAAAAGSTQAVPKQQQQQQQQQQRKQQQKKKAGSAPAAATPPAAAAAAAAAAAGQHARQPAPASKEQVSSQPAVDVVEVQGPDASGPAAAAANGQDASQLAAAGVEATGPDASGPAAGQHDQDPPVRKVSLVKQLSAELLQVAKVNPGVLV